MFGADGSLGIAIDHSYDAYQDFFDFLLPSHLGTISSTFCLTISVCSLQAAMGWMPTRVARKCPLNISLVFEPTKVGGKVGYG